MRRLYLGLAAFLAACGPPASVIQRKNTDACSSYCAFITMYCQNGNTQYFSWDACMQTCSTFSHSGAPGDSTGDTYQCRFTLLQAAQIEPLTFCDDAGPTGGEACSIDNF